jgi:hypothetical protein
MRKTMALPAVIAFMVTACGDIANGGQTYKEQTHFDTLNIADEQVWLRNYSANKLSQAYEKLDENNYVLTAFNQNLEEIGFGAINEGKLRLTVNTPGNLVAWNDLKIFFDLVAEGVGWDVTINENDAPNGTFIEILTVDEYALIREGLSGTTTSVSNETVIFVYLDRDCTITGTSKTDEQVMYTLNPFTLQLKKGWNTIWYKQTYTTFGRSSFFMDIKNPDLKWVLIPTVPTK